MASQKYILTEIKKGYNLSWYVCSQCYYTGTIKLYDDTGKVYFTCSKTSGSTSYQSLAQGHDDFTGNEDSTDEDYNDFYIDVVGWAKKG